MLEEFGQYPFYKKSFASDFEHFATVQPADAVSVKVVLYGSKQNLQDSVELFNERWNSLGALAYIAHIRINSMKKRYPVILLSPFIGASYIPSRKTLWVAFVLGYNQIPCNNNPRNLQITLNSCGFYYDLILNSVVPTSPMEQTIGCLTNSDCPFQYFCSDLNVCAHHPMFPLQWYPIIVYALIPFALTICNIGGLSGGIFKVVFLMDMLNYPISEANDLAYAMITGGALANFLLLIPRRHPMMNAPLVDHWLVFLLLPCILMGTTIGVIIGKNLNDLTQDILVILVCLYFAYKYFARFKHRKRVEKGLSIDSRADLLAPEELIGETKPYVSEARKKFDRHQAGYRSKQIVLSIIFFIALETVTAASQGKFILQFQKCSAPYFMFLGGYLVFMAMIILVMYKFSKLRVLKYRKIRFDYILRLDELPVYGKIAAGGIVAGLLQGIIGMGSGHMISLVLLSMNFRPEVTSGTAGYIIFFVGSASMIESFILGDSKWEESLLVFSVAFVGSLVLTSLALRYLKKKSKLDTTIILILAVICVVSILGVVGNLILTISTFGFGHLVQAKSVC